MAGSPVYHYCIHDHHHRFHLYIMITIGPTSLKPLQKKRKYHPLKHITICKIKNENLKDRKTSQSRGSENITIQKNREVTIEKIEIIILKKPNLNPENCSIN